MALPISLLDAHPSVQQALDFIAQRFPLRKRDLSDEVLNNFLKLGTPADWKLSTGLVSNVFAGNLAANTDGTWSPTPANLGVTTIYYARLDLVPVTSADMFTRWHNPNAAGPQVVVRNGATAQHFDGYYLVIGA